MQDLRDAFRALKATPVVTIVAALSLALGIGANTAIFSILDSLILRTLPVRDPQHLAIIGTAGEAGGRSWTNPIWEAIRDRQQIVDGAFAWSTTRFNLSSNAQTDFADGIWASGRFFDVLGVPAILGRTFNEADDRRGGGPDGPVAVISYRYWQQHFGGATDAIGKPLTVERVRYTVIGVTPPEFFGVEVGRTFDIAIPLGTEPLVRGKESALDRRSTWWLSAMMRLKPGQTLDAATAALRGIQPQIRDVTMPADYREEDKLSYMKETFELQPAATGSSSLRRRYQQPLMTIMVVVSLVLLIACANIANLLLARASARRHEMSVRLALGASRIRLMRQLLAESLLLSSAGAALGVLFAHWGSRLLVRQLSTSNNTVFLDLGLDWRVLGFTALIAIGTALLFGTAPAFRASRVQPNDALKAQGRSVAGEPRFGIGNMLVVVQVALSLVLIVAAGLFMRTFSSLANLDLGFNRQAVLVATVNASRTQLEPAQRADLYEELRRAAGAVPGVASAAASAVTPISGSTWQFAVEAINGIKRDDKPGSRSVFVNLVSPQWFETFGTRVIGGRDFTAADRLGAPPVVIVNEAFARKFTNGQNPVGARVMEVSFPNNPAIESEVVGYVKDAVYRSLRDPVPPTMYLAIAQRKEPPSGISIAVRTAGGSPALLTRSVAAALTGVNGNLSLTFRPLAEQVNNAIIQERVVAMMSGFFGGLAVVLAGLGLYGVTSYAVSRRRTELGIRMALGAAPAGVIALVLRRVGLLVGLGVLAGAGVNLWAGRFVTTLLYGLEPRDPLTLAAAIGVLGAIGIMAGWLPARRASRIDPARVLREG